MYHWTSLLPGLSVLDFVSQVWEKKTWERKTGRVIWCHPDVDTKVTMPQEAIIRVIVHASLGARMMHDQTTSHPGGHAELSKLPVKSQWH